MFADASVAEKWRGGHIFVCWSGVCPGSQGNQEQPGSWQRAQPAQAGKAGPCRLLLRSPSPAQPVFWGPAFRRPWRPPARHSSRCAATPRSRPQPRRWNRSRGDEGSRSRRGARWASAAAGTQVKHLFLQTGTRYKPREFERMTFYSFIHFYHVPDTVPLR